MEQSHSAKVELSMLQKDGLQNTPCSPMMANFPEGQVWSSRNNSLQFFCFVFLKLGLGLWLRTILLKKKLMQN